MTDPQAVFDLHKDWKVLAGPVLGLSQPALVGTAQVVLPGGFDLDALDAGLARFLEEPAPPPRTGAPPEQLLVSRAIHWAGVLQRRHDIATSEVLAVEAMASPDHAGLFRIYAPYLVKEAALTALGWVQGSIRHYLAHGRVAEDDAATAGQVRQRLTQALAPFKASINVFRFLRAADRLRIPADPVTANLIQYGIGRTSRLMVGSYIDTTSVVGAQIADNKLATATVLRRAGLPAPVHVLVASEAEAVRAAERLGYPVVVKPADRDQGQGVAAGLTEEAAVRTAFAEARVLSPNVLVERHFEGSDYRLTVFEGQVLQVIHRRPGGVTGDGASTLAALVEAEAALPESRRRERQFGRRLLLLDDEALSLAREQGLEADSVVAAERFVRLRRRANVSSGGTPLAMPLAEVHPDTLALAVRAAAALRLNLAGVDLITPDIARSWLETGVLICEVNGQPQISQTGSPEVHADILRAILGPRPRVPIIAYVSRDAPAGLPALALADAALGTSSAGGLWLNGKPFVGPQRNAFVAAKALFAHPAIDAALVHLTPTDIVERGLPFSHCDAAIIADDAIEERQAFSWLEPHVLGEIFAPARGEGLVRRSRPSAGLVSREDPWSAATGIIASLAPAVRPSRAHGEARIARRAPEEQSVG